ncbi:uncharacterized protein LOC121274520 isoform X2 [Carcharodon carcharias]|uniref:uncharacterized protein LOC121274520 isoform X2 n=1 Tax=Carcharodon carcharias TaxID=13397 RepID=UPI001B7DE835|nr:uncharacterized protein LOC121274520 isoform X2 [Carcharodon carcharias]
MVELEFNKISGIKILMMTMKPLSIVQQIDVFRNVLPKRLVQLDSKVNFKSELDKYRNEDIFSVSRGIGLIRFERGGTDAMSPNITDCANIILEMVNNMTQDSKRLRTRPISIRRVSLRSCGKAQPPENAYCAKHAQCGTRKMNVGDRRLINTDSQRRCCGDGERVGAVKPMVQRFPHLRLRFPVSSPVCTEGLMR